MRLTLVIVTRGRPDVLRETLESLAGCDPLPDEMIVVDGSADESARPALAAFARACGGLACRYLVSRPGLPTQRNRGLASATGDVIVFADDDVLFDPGVFAALRGAYGEPQVVGATGRVIEGDPALAGPSRAWWRRLLQGRSAEGTMTRYGYPRRLQDLATARDVEFMSGCLMSARRDAAKRVGFDERLEALAPYALAEDEDFSYRLSRLGRLRYVPSARVVHRRLGVGTAASRGFNRQVTYNRAYLFAKNFPQTAIARVQFALLVALLIVHRAARREWSGVLGLAEGALAAWQAGRGRAVGRGSLSGAPRRSTVGRRAPARRRRRRGARRPP